MYAFQLPKVIPVAGSLDGPPLPQDYTYIGGMGIMGDPRNMFLACIRDPSQLQPTIDRMMAMAAAQRKK